MSIGVNNNNPAMAEYDKVREDNDFDMVFLVAKHLENDLGSKPAADLFLSDPMIQAVADKTSGVQRVMINRYFTTLLLIFRSNNDVDITDVIYYLVADGYIEDWFTLFRSYIIPFLKAKNVYGTVKS